MRYGFILGHNPTLSVAEVLAALPNATVVTKGNSFLVVEHAELDCSAVMEKLGGTIKIGEIIADTVSASVIIEKLKAVKADNKLKFGISYYECPPDKLGMKVKGVLKQFGISCRLVVGRDKALSSVIVVKNKVHEFSILGGKLLLYTRAVQDFESYGHRDFGRPARDLKSGSMPPKLAKIMINLAGVATDKKIHDPFCGSGTVIQEALLLGYKNVSGSDVSERAISDTNTNLEWLMKNSSLTVQLPAIFQTDVAELSAHVKNVDAIVAEPYLGPPLKGYETEAEIQKNINELEHLYVQAFGQFAKVLNSAGVVVLIFPSFRVGKRVYGLKIFDQIKNLGFAQTSADDLFYSREGQHVYRNVRVFKLDT